MRLNEWLIRSGMTDQAFAALLDDGTDRTTISRIRRGRRMPSPELMRKICTATDGAVTANDFVHPSEPSEAA